jgi:putative RNA 2'-phosphotransferase
MSAERQKRLSKLLSLILRHEAEKFGLSLDEEGWAGLAELLAAMGLRHEWREVSEAEVREVVESSDKQRFEIQGGRIRARYGHSVPQTVRYPEVEPPEVLYHGTAPESLPAIQVDGLRSMRRQYVHLSLDVEQARAVGQRHSHRPVVLRVRARAAWEAGVKFYQPEARLYLSPAVPAAFVQEGGEGECDAG